MPDTIREATFESVRRLVKAQTVKCPAVHSTEGTCGEALCRGTYRVLNPAYAPLLALFQDKCPKLGKMHYHHARYYRVGADCGQISSRIYYWQEAPDGALRGSLEDAIAAGFNGLKLWGRFDSITDQAALVAIEKWQRGT